MMSLKFGLRKLASQVIFKDRLDSFLLDFSGTLDENGDYKRI